MHTVKRCLRLYLPVAFLFVIVSTGTPATADEDMGKTPPKPAVGAKQVKDGFYRATAIRFSGAVKLGGGNAGLPVDWEPPICWYEPTMTSTQMRAAVGSILWTHYITSVSEDSKWVVNDFHEGDEGMFWTPTCAANILSKPELAWLDPRPFAIWVAAGDPPPPGGITPEMLAEIVRANLVLPEFKIGVNPPVRSVVNLPTWVWALDLPAEPLWATASLPGGPSATVTARPVGMAIDPGTAEAVTFPAGGTCAGTGKPYRAGMTGEPACGVTYLRPTTGLPEGYQLRAELVWEVTWAGSDGSGGMLPEGRFGSVRQVPVAEIQAIVER